MVLNLVFLVHALSAVFYGLLLVFLPHWVAGLLTGGAAVLQPLGEALARLYGICCIGIGVATWLARSSSSTHARRLVLIAMLATESLGFLVGFTIPFPTARYFTILFYLIFVLAYLYVLLFRPQEI